MSSDKLGESSGRKEYGVESHAHMPTFEELINTRTPRPEVVGKMAVATLTPTILGAGRFLEAMQNAFTFLPPGAPDNLLPEEKEAIITGLAVNNDGGREWQEDALCAQTDPETFFPERGASTREAKRICAGCEVKAECLEFALKHDERWGVWGGLSERERRKLKKLE